MIVSFKNRDLERFFKEEDGRGIRGDLRKRVRAVLDLLDRVKSLEDVELIHRRLHGYIGGGKGTFSLDVNRTWRITFTWDGENAANVDLTQPH